MNLNRSFFRPRALHAILLAALLGGGAQASKFVLSPVIMQLNPQQQLSTSTTLTNSDSVPVEFTAELFAWTQVNGKDVLEPTRTAVVSPMRFKIAPGKSQVVRVALRTAPSHPSATYRLILRQVPAPAAPSSGTQMTVTPRYVFSLPLFAERPGARPDIKVSAQRTDGKLTLTLVNQGSGYAAYRNMMAVTQGKRLELGSVYILPGATRTLNLPAELAEVQNFGVVTSINGQAETSFNVDVR